MRQGVKSYFYCGEPGYIARFCYKEKNKKQEQLKNANHDDDYAFVIQNEAHFKNVSNWIMGSGASKHITLHRFTFYT